MRTHVPPAEKAMGLSAGRPERRWAAEMGALAWEVLTAEACRGEVCAVLADVIYLATNKGTLLWLSSNRAFPHQRYIYVPSLPRGIQAGATFVSREGALEIGEVVVELTSARMRYPFQPSGHVGPTSAKPRPRFDTLLSVVRNGLIQTASCGLLRLVVASPLVGPVGSLEEPFFEAALATVDRVRAACRRGDLSGVLRAGLGLVGMGPGFTPAGDDFLGGLLFTLRHLHHAFGGEARWDEERVDDFLAAARPHTGWVSHTILSDLAHGHGPGPLHDLILNLSASRGPVLADHARRLAQIGHSSGRDLLAGVLTARWWRDGARGGGMR